MQKHTRHRRIILFKDHQDAFKEYLIIKNYSKMSVYDYLLRVNSFLIYLARKGIDDIRQISRDNIRDYQQYITTYKNEEGKQYALSTISCRLLSIKKFFQYLEETQKILYNPAFAIRLPKLGRRLPRNIITKQEAKKILDRPNTSTRLGIRDKTILEVLYSTGIRLEELYNLTIYDVDYTTGFLRVNKGKFAKDRVVPLGKKSCHYLREYIKKIRPQLTKKTKEERALFVGLCGRKMNKQIISRLISEYAKKAVNKRVTAHTWRHSFASHLLADGADVIHVQKLLGHSDPQITQIYTKVTPREVKQTHDKRHPREKDKNEKITKVKKDMPCQGKYKNPKNKKNNSNS